MHISNTFVSEANSFITAETLPLIYSATMIVDAFHRHCNVGNWHGSTRVYFKGCRYQNGTQEFESHRVRDIRIFFYLFSYFAKRKELSL